ALTGRPAFAGDDPTTTLTSVLYDEPERPKVLRKDLPDGLELVIQRAMAKVPEARYASMAEFDEALAPFDTGPGGAHANGQRASGVVSAAPGDVARAATVAVQTGSLLLTSEGARARRARPRAVAYGIAMVSWTTLVLASLIGATISDVMARPLAPVES